MAHKVPATVGRRQLLPFAALSASYFAHIGFFNPYLPLWLKDMGMSVLVIGVLASLQSVTRVFAPYAWGALSDRTGERVRLLRYCTAAALLASGGLWVQDAGYVWLGVVLLVMFTHTSPMMGLTETAMAHLVAGDWGRYGRIRLWGSVGFLVTVLAAGAWFERFGLAHFPAWTALTLVLVLVCSWWVPNSLELPVAGADQHVTGLWAVVRQPAMQWFFASLMLHVMAHFAVYVFMSLYLDSLGFGKDVIGALWAFSVLVEIAWFFVQGRFVERISMPTWLAWCAAAMALRMAMTAGWGHVVWVLLLAQALHAVTFAAHHTASIAIISHHFSGRLRARGQAIFTIVGYGVGGSVGVLSGGALASAYGLASVFWAASAVAAGAGWCSLQVMRHDKKCRAGLSGGV